MALLCAGVQILILFAFVSGSGGCLDDAVLFVSCSSLFAWCCLLLFFEGPTFILPSSPLVSKTVTLLSFDKHLSAVSGFLADFFTLILVSHLILGHQPSVTTFNVALREFCTS